MKKPAGFRPLAIATGAVCVASVLAYGGRWSWACELLVNFRTHYVLLTCLALILALALRTWRIATLAVFGLALNAWPLHAAFLVPESPPASSSSPVRIAAFNVNVANDDMPGVAAYLESLAVDVAVLEEVSQASEDALAKLLPELPHRYFGQHDGLWGVVILSRWPLIEPRPAMRDGLKFAARADIALGDRRFRLYGAHLHWPLMPATLQVRNAQLRALGRELAECDHACVVVGDFNVTPWSSHFRDVLKISGARDCAVGRGLLTTWPSGLPSLLGIRIDQCLVSGNVSVGDVRVGGNVGSDHFATINSLNIGGP